MKKLLAALFVALAMPAHAQTINNLGAGAAVSGTDMFPAYQGSNPAKRVTADQIKAFVGVNSANPSGLVGMSPVVGVATTYMRSDAAPAINPTILTTTGEANKIARFDSGGVLNINTANFTTAYGSDSIFNSGTGQWVNMDFSSQEIDFIKTGESSVSIGIAGVDAGDKPITTSKIPAAANDVINKAYADGIAFPGLAAPYTWTGAHRFNAVSSATVPSVQLSSTNPQLDIMFSSGAVDAKRWNWQAGTNTLALRALNDAGTTGSNAWTATRAAGIVTAQQWLTGNVGRVTLSETALAIQPPTSVITGADGNKLWLGKYDSGSGHSNAPTAIGAASTYMYVGGREYGNNGYGGIGFSYVADTTNHPAVWIGWQETATAGNTMGDFIVATRPVTTNTAPVERLRVPAAGNVHVAGAVSAAVTTAPASPTNSGVTISSAPNVADVVLYDSTQTANNRTAEWINFQGKLQARFKNDAGSSAIVPMAFVGGQGLGITGIESNSGSGVWAHTGNFSITGGTLSVANVITATPSAITWLGNNVPWQDHSGNFGVPGDVWMSTGNATTPAWSTPLPSRTAVTSQTAQSANVNQPSVYNAVISGLYRVSCYVVITRAATTSATMPGCSVTYTEPLTTIGMQDIVTLSSVTNTLGAHSGASTVIQAQVGSGIGYATNNYASSGATTMQYHVAFIVERLQ